MHRQLNVNKNMKPIYPLLALVLFTPALFAAPSLWEFEVTDAWTNLIEERAPEKPQVAPQEKRKALVFSLMTGFKHWCTPHTTEMIRILGEKSGAYEVVISDDIAYFEKDKIKQFDLIFLNNTCSDREKRHLFYDVLKDMDKAEALEQNLLDHVAGGAGLVAIHGGIVMLNNSPAFSEMLGGSFDFHPRQQTVVGQLVDKKHPITSAFKGTDLVHYDEPYMFKNAYADLDFHPLLKMEIIPDEKTLSDKRYQAVMDTGLPLYISWIKRHGKGRVFYCSPSHNAQSFEQTELLQFILNGIQYAAGDLECDDTPIGK